MKKSVSTLILGALVLAGPIFAATITVDSTADNNAQSDGNCTLREAIDNANSDSDSTGGDCAAGSGADVIEFDTTIPDNSTITLGSAGELLLTSDISILPYPDVEGLVIDANASSPSSERRVMRQTTAGSDVVIDHLTLTGGVVDEQGGGYRFESGSSLTMTNSRITGNMTLSTGSNGDGGGLMIEAGTSTLTNVTIDGNISADDGGALNVAGSSVTATLLNVTMCNNDAGDDGGAIEVLDATVTIAYSTIFANRAGVNDGSGAGETVGGGIYTRGGTINFGTTIIAGNLDCDGDCASTVASACATSSGGSIASQGYNLFDSGLGCPGGVGSDVICGGECSGNPASTGLGPLADNGGPVLTHAINCTTSPAVDQIPSSQAACSGSDDYDARGVARPGSGYGTSCDIGAFECTTATVPVTLAYFSSRAAGKSVLFEWSTATEVGTMGFNLYEITPVGRRQLNGTMLPAGFESTTRRDYDLHTIHAVEKSFYLEEIDLDGRRQTHGPFELGRTYGARIDPEPIDWASVRGAVARSAQQRLLSAAVGESRWATSRVDEGRRRPEARFFVDTSGLYRVSREALLPYGIDLSSPHAERLVLTSAENVSVPYAVLAGGTALEFWGDTRDSLYGSENSYRLTVGRGGVFVPSAELPIVGVPHVDAYEEYLNVEESGFYSFTSLAEDPWAAARLIANGGSAEHDFDLVLDDWVPGTDAMVMVEVWGQTRWADVIDHQVDILVNGSLVASQVFDDRESASIEALVPAADLVPGTNTLTVRVPTPPPEVPWDIVTIERYEAKFLRRFVARSDELRVSGVDGSFQVEGLGSAEAVVWELGVQPRRWTTTATLDGGTYRLIVPGEKGEEWRIASDIAARTPTIQPTRVQSLPRLPGVEYLILTHGSLRSALGPLVDLQIDRGYEVEIVDVETLYDHYSGGLVDAGAIQRFIRERGTPDLRFVLLAGGDSYDYDDHLGIGSVSLIPSLYTPTGDLARWAPVDPLYTDLDGDELSDLPIGRLPARTAEELDSMIQKILDYENRDWGSSALLAADQSVGVPFGAISEGFASVLPADWELTRAYLDDDSVAGVRQTLFETINRGVGLTTFFGHSGPNSWTFAGLLTSADASALENFDQPTAVAQWGCWNTYYVEPAYDTLAHAWMLHDGGGAAMVLGAATITESASELALAEHLMPLLGVPGVTIGEALQAAKEDLAATSPHLRDVLLGWTLLGDPAQQLGNGDE